MDTGICGLSEAKCIWDSCEAWAEISKTTELFDEKAESIDKSIEEFPRDSKHQPTGNDWFWFR